jgi:hypothetical protein
MTRHGPVLAMDIKGGEERARREGDSRPEHQQTRRLPSLPETLASDAPPWLTAAAPSAADLTGRRTVMRVWRRLLALALVGFDEDAVTGPDDHALVGAQVGHRDLVGRDPDQGPFA